MKNNFKHLLVILLLSIFSLAKAQNKNQGNKGKNVPGKENKSKVIKEKDSDKDGISDNKDDDDDNDGIKDNKDNDRDGDGIENEKDEDDKNNQLSGSHGTKHNNQNLKDSDKDGISDNKDDDDDNDGIFYRTVNTLTCFTDSIVSYINS